MLCPLYCYRVPSLQLSLGLGCSVPLYCAASSAVPCPYALLCSALHRPTALLCSVILVNRPGVTELCSGASWQMLDGLSSPLEGNSGWSVWTCNSGASTTHPNLIATDPQILYLVSGYCEGAQEATAEHSLAALPGIYSATKIHLSAKFYFSSQWTSRGAYWRFSMPGWHYQLGVYQYYAFARAPGQSGSSSDLYYQISANTWYTMEVDIDLVSNTTEGILVLSSSSAVLASWTAAPLSRSTPSSALTTYTSYFRMDSLATFPGGHRVGNPTVVLPGATDVPSAATTSEPTSEPIADESGFGMACKTHGCAGQCNDWPDYGNQANCEASCDRLASGSTIQACQAAAGGSTFGCGYSICSDESYGWLAFQGHTLSYIHNKKPSSI